jgi:hypothetical protein
MRTVTTCLLTAALGLALASQSAAQQRPPDTTPPYGGTWYRDADVRKAMTITDEQIKRLNEAYDKFGTRYREDYGRLDKLTDRERADRLRELTQTYRTDLYKSYADILDEKQMARYRQLDLQYRGWNSFNDPDVVKGLSLSEEQLGKLRELSAQADRTMRDIVQASGTDLDAASRRYADHRARTWEQINRIFNEDQRRAWTRLTGDPYDFPPPFGRRDR